MAWYSAVVEVEPTRDENGGMWRTWYARPWHPLNWWERFKRFVGRRI